MSEQMLRELKALRREVEKLKIRRSDRPQFTAACMRFLMLPELRGFWPGSSINESGNVYDLSGQGRILTNNNAVSRSFLTNGTPYLTFNGTTQFLSRADEAGLSINTFTMGGWFYHSSLTNNQSLITKTTFGVAPYSNDTFGLFKANTTNLITASIAGGGASEAIAGEAVPVNTWYFAAMVFHASTTLAVWVNDTPASQASAIATLNDTAIPFNIGSYNNTSSNNFQLNGRAGPCFLCAAAFPDTLLEDLYQSTRNLFGV